MDGWQMLLMGLSAYVAVMSLVRLMRQRQERIFAELQRELEQEQRRRKKEKRKEPTGRWRKKAA